MAWGTLPFSSALYSLSARQSLRLAWGCRHCNTGKWAALLGMARPPRSHGYWLLSYLRSLNVNVHVKPPIYSLPFNTILTLEHQVGQSHGSQSTHLGSYLPQGHGALRPPVQPSRLGLWDSTLKSRSLEEAAYGMISHRGGGRIWSYSPANLYRSNDAAWDAAVRWNNDQIPRKTQHWPK